MTIEQKEQIKRLREDGYGYGKIASMLGLSDNTVKSFCRRQGLTKVSANKGGQGDDLHFCKCCGIPIVQMQGRKEKKFCSDTCRMRWWNSHLNEVKRKAVYEFECAFCHRLFTAYGNANRKYCSHDCYVEDRFGGGRP